MKMLKSIVLYTDIYIAPLVLYKEALLVHFSSRKKVRLKARGRQGSGAERIEEQRGEGSSGDSGHLCLVRLPTFPGS